MLIFFMMIGFDASQSAWLFKNLRTKQIAKSGMAATLVSNLTGVCGGCGYRAVRVWRPAVRVSRWLPSW